MPHDNVNRALAVLSDFLEKSGHQRIATAANADDVLNAFDAMRQNLREEAYRTLLENKQKLFNDLRSVTTSFGLTIQSMAALGQDTKAMQRLQGLITKITADLSFTGEDDVNQDGVRDSAEGIEQGQQQAPQDLSIDPALQQSDELFQSLAPNSNAPAVPAEQAAEEALQQNNGGFADDIDTDDLETSTPGSGGMADDFEDTKSLDQAVTDATQDKEAPAEQTEEQGEGGEGGEDPFASVPEGDEGGSPFDGTSNDDTGNVGSSGGAPVAEQGEGPSDDQLNDMFNQEFPPAKKAAPAPAPQKAQSSVELVTFDGLSSIKRTKLIVATAADGSTAFYRASKDYMDGDTETVASMLSQIRDVRGNAAAARSVSTLVSEASLVEAYRA